jgi:hypothetical protein
MWHTQERRKVGRRWKNNINVDLKKVLEGFDWIHMAESMDQCCGLVNVIVTFGSP